MTAPRLVLASTSPRRRRLLEQLGLRFDVVPATVDEAALPGEEAVAHVERLALHKARAVAAERPDAVVIGGDTVVVLDGEILTKPVDPEDAVATLMRLSGREHRVETGVAVVAPHRAVVAVVGADVRFRAFGHSEAEDYAATGEPLDKAGAYGIQGKGAVLVDSIRGDYFAVMGLPLVAVVRLLREVGIRYRFDGQIVAGEP
ncbi:MAG: septum formation inhibitor Maf [Gemmatimonadetes bacterium]|nr:septum formation inhibitor Maf [Gemmatimonadota bacterium]NIQ59864.1 septum formation inhibitor Maf [Gemmatimonadota bacterium]NIU80065.1 septum formation inhibitor Maf [Gammaproteobacteria bacterium]NIX46755.1 septum formation inhibitor Maf [Gemmatimonadota bacterium]NIY12931.1 septum formation inhibitor Maf [Gemmatimonadota bacterium]